MRGFFARWSIKLSAEYYEAKDRHKAAAATPEIAVPDQARPT